MTTTTTTPSEPTGIKLIKEAESFLAYCKANPNQRFWQALLNWSQMPWIFISTQPIYKYPEHRENLIDPYHWQGVKKDA